jgi:hypothetical protein
MLCSKLEDGPTSLLTYDASIKCCTYLPELHNFLAGEILADCSPEAARGRETVESRLRSRAAVTPLGLLRPRAYTVLYRNQGRNDFGTTRSFRCPHYLEGGLCGVWQHRESTCATWFCKYTRGATGARFWRTLHHLLQSIERALARSCVLELDPGPESLALLMAPPPLLGQDEEPLDGILEPRIYRKLWGLWAGREVAFYDECARIVAGLGWSEIVARCGPEVALHGRVVAERFKQLTSEALPRRLALGPFQVVALTEETARLSTYSRLDPIDVARPLLDVLSAFNGRPTDEILAEIARDEGLRITPALVRRLVDFEVLKPVED